SPTRHIRYGLRRTLNRVEYRCAASYLLLECQIALSVLTQPSRQRVVTALRKSKGVAGWLRLSAMRMLSIRRVFPPMGTGAMLLPIALAGCFRNPSAVRPPRPINYWEALAELHPADAVAAARTPSETEFAEALGDLMAGNIEKAEARFRELRKSAADSVIRAGSRVVYTATLQYQEKWQVLSALKSESTQTPSELHDRASIELWADA